MLLRNPSDPLLKYLVIKVTLEPKNNAMPRPTTNRGTSICCNCEDRPQSNAADEACCYSIYCSPPRTLYASKNSTGTEHRPIPIKKLVVSNPSKVTSCLKSEVCGKI